MSLLQIDNLQKNFHTSSGHTIQALNGVSLELFKGETLGLVGESGSGKSTLAKILMQLESTTIGSFKIEGRDFREYSKSEFFALIQMVFQDPFSSLNPRKTIFSIITEPLRIQSKLSKKELQIIAQEKLELVGLDASYLKSYPHVLSGGQRQRIGIARALTLNPKILILDEPISALDVSIQASVLNLLVDLQKELDLSYLFIGHDLNVIRYLCDRVAVMYLGEIVEMGATKDLFTKAHHPYTQALVKSSLELKQGEEKSSFFTLEGEIPSPISPPTGCRFHNRCPMAQDICKEKIPSLVQLPEKKAHYSSCYINQ